MKLSAKLPHDDEGAQLMRFESVCGQRYTEIFLIGGNVLPHHLLGGIYNTIGLNDPDGTGDTCPQEVLDVVDVDELKEQFDSSARSRTARGCGHSIGWRSWSARKRTSTDSRRGG